MFMIIRYDTLKIIISELTNLFYRILLNEISNFKNDLVTYNVVVNTLNNIKNNYDKIIKQNIDQLINKHFVSDEKDYYITIDFPFIKILYSKLDNNMLTTNTHFLDTIKVEFPTVYNFKDIFQPLHSIINKSFYVDEEFLNHHTTQEYLLIEKHILNLISEYVDYINYQILTLMMFKVSKIMINHYSKSPMVENNNKVLGIVTIDKSIICDNDYSYTYKWVYGIFDVSNLELENTMKLYLNFLSKKYNSPDTKIHCEYIPITSMMIDINDR